MKGRSSETVAALVISPLTLVPCPLSLVLLNKVLFEEFSISSVLIGLLQWLKVCSNN